MPSAWGPAENTHMKGPLPLVPGISAGELEGSARGTEDTQKTMVYGI